MMITALKLGQLLKYLITKCCFRSTFSIFTILCPKFPLPLLFAYHNYLCIGSLQLLVSIHNQKKKKFFYRDCVLQQTSKDPDDTFKKVCKVSRVANVNISHYNSL